ACGNVAKNFRVRAFRIGCDDGCAGVGFFPDVERKRHFAQKRHVKPFGFAARADITIGPRQIIGVSSSTKKPIDITGMPWRTIGLSRVPPAVSGRSRMASSLGSDGP